MGSKIGLVDLKLTNDDGTPISRLQAEQQLRNETVYHRRLRAFKVGLPNKVVQHMLPISVTHWLLDYWIQSGKITGEVLGIRSEFDADDNKEYVRQLSQRLALFVEYGLAVKPNPGEGIDMSNFNGQPPGFPSMPPMPGQPQQQPQQSFVPPPPPMPGMSMPGMGPQMQQPPQGYAQGMPPMPPVPQPSFPQTPPGFTQAPQPQMQQPQFQQPPQQTQPQAQGGAPVKLDPARQWGQAGKREDGTQRTRRTKEEVSEDANYEAWVKAGGDPNVGAVAQAPQQQQAPQVPQPQMQQPPMGIAPPNPFGNNVPNPMMPAPGQFPAMPQAAPPAPAAVAVPAVTSASEEQLTQLQNRVDLLEKGLAMVLRVLYGKPATSQGDADLYLVLTEVCGIRP